MCCKLALFQDVEEVKPQAQQPVGDDEEEEVKPQAQQPVGDDEEDEVKPQAQQPVGDDFTSSSSSSPTG